MSDTRIAALADAAGILIDWEDAGGVAQRVTVETLRLVLTGLGLACDSDAQCAESMAWLRDAEASPCRIIDAGGRIEGLAGEGKLILEDGSERDVDLDAAPMMTATGYHRLAWDGGDLAIIVTPRACHGLAPGSRAWGVGAQIYALRDGNPFGDFATLTDFARSAAGAGADAVMLSPVHALFTEDPSRYSPYSPSTRQFLNPWFAAAGDGWGGTAPVSPLIDWTPAVAAKLLALRRIYAERGGDPAFHAYAAAADPALIGHARFEALYAHFLGLHGARGWQAWPEPYRRPESPEVTAFAETRAEDVRFHLFLQWLADRSLAEAAEAASTMRIGLVADLAVGLDAGGSHAWSRGEELMLGIGIGAPPDAFQAAGQNWGITSYSPFALKRLGYQPFIDLLRGTMRHMGGLRIDHALGLRRLWVVPTGASPLDGAYLRFPEQDLLRLIALESQRNQAMVIGEDLGVVPPGFRDMIAERGLLGMRVLPFERDRKGHFTASSTWDADAVAMTSTHDLPPIAGWWRERDIDWRAQLGAAGDRDAERTDRARDRTDLWRACVAAGAGEGDEPAADEPARAVDAAIAFAAAAPSAVLAVPVEDLFGLDEAPNLPGTVDEHPNWRRRLPADADTLFAQPDVAARIATIRTARPE